MTPAAVVLQILAFFLLVSHSKSHVENRNSESIVGGEQVFDNDLTFTALVMGDVHTCGGSVISKQHIITAAHCHEGDEKITSAIVGVHDYGNFSRGEFMNVQEVFIHEDYDPTGTVKNDIAIVKLKTPISLDYVKPVSLARYKSLERTLSSATIAGWGRTDAAVSTSDSVQLQRAKNFLLSVEHCRIDFANKDVENKYTILSKGLDESQFCGLPIKGGYTASGDSGGPVVRRIGDEDVLVGAISGGVEKSIGNPRNFPTIFSSVANAFDFIEAHSEGHTWYSNVTP